MNTESFFSFYDLKETEIVSIDSEGNDLSILLNLHLDIKLIANGFRPEFDNYFLHKFIFKNVPSKIHLSSPIHVSSYIYDHGIHMIVDGMELEIPDTEIKIISNYQAK